MKGARPEDERWRANALGRSPHTRLADEIRPPEDDFDTARARLACAQICRELLGDLAPALALLPLGERQRAQALAAHVRALASFAAQHGFEGERLAHINRWEFEIDRALAGNPAGQPVFVAMSAEHQSRPWSVPALKALASVARSAAIQGGDVWRGEKAATSICIALRGAPPGSEIERLTRRLLTCLVTRSRKLATGSDPSPSAGTHEKPDLERRLARVDRSALPPPWRRVLRFLCAVGDASCRSATAPPAPLGFFSRVHYLARALLLG